MVNQVSKSEMDGAVCLAGVDGRLYEHVRRDYGVHDRTAVKANDKSWIHGKGITAIKT